jgi:hypothetical protein
VSEQAIQVIGLQASVGEKRRLRLHSTTLGGDFGCLLEARCVAAEIEPQTEQLVAQFEITKISERDLEYLRALIQSTTFCDLE